VLGLDLDLLLLELLLLVGLLLVLEVVEVEDLLAQLLVQSTNKIVASRFCGN